MSTGHIKLWWAVKKQPDSFNIYHSLAPFSPTNLPVPVATGLSATAREFRHLDQEHQYDHYYRIASVKNGRLYVSRGILVRKKPDVNNKGNSFFILKSDAEDLKNDESIDYFALADLRTFTAGDLQPVDYFPRINGYPFILTKTQDELAMMSQVDDWTNIILDDKPVDNIGDRLEFMFNSGHLRYEKDESSTLFAKVKRDYQQGVAFVIDTSESHSGGYECVIPRIESKAPFTTGTSEIGTSDYMGTIQKRFHAFYGNYYLHYNPTSGAMSNTPSQPKIHDLADSILPPSDPLYQNHPLIKQGYEPITININGDYVMKVNVP